jgi:2-polyprenyl-3-methyl-5-hydroxy-6-metoxy-1,4-benzoquinol methylase
MNQVNKAIRDLQIQVEPTYKAQIAAFGPLDYPLLTNLIKTHNITRVLDVGTGEGSFLIGLANRTENIAFDAIDLNKNLISIAKFRNEEAKLNIDFQQANFGVNYSEANYDLIMARFAIEHIKEMKDIDSFLITAYEKLNSSGWLVIIEYYIHDLDIDDPVWEEFRKSELATYNSVRAHTRISLRLPQSLKKANFRNISSTINHISPITIGAESFFNLVQEYTKLYSQINPDCWTKEMVEKIIKWCDKKQVKGDPTLFTSHTIGQKY